MSDGIFVAVYRSRNATRLATLVEQADDAGLTVALWALDEVAPVLASRTVGTGRGTKFDLLNRLLEGSPHPAEGPVVVSDDDVAMRRQGLVELISLSRAADLDLAQPAHVRTSVHSHRITRRRCLSRVRQTSFVEIGPLFLIRGRGLQRVLPFPADVQMGWGLDVRWAAWAIAGDLRLGVVDAVPMRHLDPAGVSYSDREATDRLNRELAACGVTDVKAVQRNLGTWWVWQHSPPWPTRER